MIKWLLLFLIGYILYKSISPLIAIFRLNQNIKKKNRKKDIHTKIKKMDIRDAEFEDKL
tara:strand:- start:167 stop:343 length:177 start_codon:yes stop_codon:yes gene_type:complete